MDGKIGEEGKAMGRKYVCDVRLVWGVVDRGQQ